MEQYLFVFPISLALLLGVMSPGPSFFLVAQTAMAKSRKEALFVSLGMGIGAMIFAFLAISGLYILLQTSPLLYQILKIAGGLYLCYLAYKIFTSNKTQKNIQKIESKSSKQSFFLGLFTQLSNPKTAIVIGSIFAAFLPTQIPPYSLFILCFIAFALDATWYCIVAIALSTQKAQKTYLSYKKYINIASSTFILLIALKLFLD